MKAKSAILFTALCSWSCGGLSAPESRDDRLLAQRIDEYLAARLDFYPVEATEAGLHERDGSLGHFSETDFKSRISWLKDFHQKLLGIDLTVVSRDRYFDGLQLLSAVRAELHELDTLLTWKQSPELYGRAVENGIFSLAGGEFQTPHGRARAVVSRLRAIPALAEAAKANCERPTSPAIEAGVASLTRAQRLLRDLPKFFSEVTSQSLMADLASASEEADRALQDLATDWRSVAPGARPPAGIGEENLRTLLLYEEMEDVPLAELREKVKRQVKGIQASLAAQAAQLNPKKSVPELLRELGSVHAPATELLSSTRALITEMRGFVVERGFVALEGELPVGLVETPAFLRNDVRLALERTRSLPAEASSARVFLTAPDIGWTKAQVEQHLSILNTRTLRLDVAREVYPGRFTLLNATRRSGTPFRRALPSRAAREGWPLYAEQVAVELGCCDDPQTKLAAHYRALVEDIRLLGCLSFHMGQLGLTQVADLFVREAYFTPPAAQQEALALAAGVDRLFAPLGKLQILSLREDFRATGKTLREFHDAFFATGAPPLKLARTILFYETGVRRGGADPERKTVSR